MNIETKFNIGDTVMVKKKCRSAALPEDENNKGRVIEITTTTVGTTRKNPTVVEYELEFKDPDTGEVEPDWNEVYEEEALEEVK